jgi:hypothetical protein
MAALSLLGMLVVLGVEAYALYQAFGSSGAIELTFGSSDCRSCYSRLFKSGLSCQRSGFCYQEPATTAFCLANDLVGNVYELSGAQLYALSSGTCGNATYMSALKDRLF